MSLLLKAFPHGRPIVRASRALFVLAVATSLVIVMLPLAGTAAAGRLPDRPAQHQAQQLKSVSLMQAPARKKKKKKKKKKRPRVIGQPRGNYVIPAGTYFSYPNRGKRSRLVIRNRVLATVKSVWGGRRDAHGDPLITNGTIRMVSWTFDDWEMARALVAAKKRGVSVQIIVAKAANKGHRSWFWLRKKLGHRLYSKRSPTSISTRSYARYCRGSCRGRGGTAHSKFFLFDNVGARHTRHVTVQTSMNLTTFGFRNQWNHAQAWHAKDIWLDHLTVFAQSRVNRAVRPSPYRVRYMAGGIVDYFFPRYNVTAAQDPLMGLLSRVSCTGAATSPGGRTRINVVQYAIYGSRGLWIAKRLRYLWESGCSVRILYSIANRPVLSVLRNHRGRGPIPMRQSVVTNGYGTITKYNHSKWITVIGRHGSSRAAYLTFTGSANWSDLALTGDEQMQQISSRTVALRHLSSFARTWRQRSSHKPGYGIMPVMGGRVIPTFAPDVPMDEPAWGKGIYRFMEAD